MGVWAAAIFTLCIFSFLYRDNAFYKFAEAVVTVELRMRRKWRADQQHGQQDCAGRHLVSLLKVEKRNVTRGRPPGHWTKVLRRCWTMVQ